MKVFAGFWRKAAIEKTDITDNQYDNACIAVDNMRRLCDRQEEEACRIRTNRTRPELSLASVNWLESLCKHELNPSNLWRLEHL